MDALLKLLEGETIFGINWSLIILFIAGVAFIYEKIYRPWRDNEIKKYESMKNRDKKLDEALNEIKKFQEARLHDREKSRQIQKTLTDSINRIEQKQDIFAQRQEDNIKKLHELDERSKNYELSSTRDKLLQLYRYYTNEDLNPLGQWSSLESAAFWGIFKSYEAANGNGEMHTTVQPAMNKLLVVDVNDVESMNRLIESRKRK